MLWRSTSWRRETPQAGCGPVRVRALSRELPPAGRERRCPPPPLLPSWERLGTLAEGAHSPLPGGPPGPHPLRLPAPCPRPACPLRSHWAPRLVSADPHWLCLGCPPFSALRDPIHPSRPSQTVTFPGAFSVPLLGQWLFPLFPWLASMHWLISSVLQHPPHPRLVWGLVRTREPWPRLCGLVSSGGTGGCPAQGVLCTPWSLTPGGERS